MVIEKIHNKNEEMKMQKLGATTRNEWTLPPIIINNHLSEAMKLITLFPKEISEQRYIY